MKRGSSIGLFGRFGRSEDLRRLDEALRRVDVHPAIVREPIKLAAVSLMKDEAGGAEPSPLAYGPAAEILAYCMVGPEAFLHANGEAALERVEARVERALEEGESLDARLVLLTMHAGAIQPGVVARFGLEAD
ncbi:hypothetical protein [Salinarimonas ramus]|uniref:Uncharacterized protein n=1 Tax=Salinarimonas ramus TaxID=690164 RepID=A0A917Q3P9_9HYPH|nr:hypothetical protein [Salinarimonas ramus]GGK18665.1 hypothetical protein GCM10011322_01700 [Salinarimonas ramus]